MAKGNRPTDSMIESIFSAMQKIEKSVTIHAIAEYAKIDYKTARRYIPLIINIQSKPKITSKDTHYGPIYGLRGVNQKKKEKPVEKVEEKTEPKIEINQTGV